MIKNHPLVGIKNVNNNKQIKKKSFSLIDSRVAFESSILYCEIGNRKQTKLQAS